MKKTIKQIDKEFDEEFRYKFGRFYYSDTVGMDWQKPEKQNVTGEIPDNHNGFCIASDDIEDYIKQFLHETIKEVLDCAIGEERKKHTKGSFVEHRNDFNEGYNQKRQELINLKKEMFK